MKTTICLILSFILTSPALFAQNKAGRIDTVKHAAYYSCPTHKDILSNGPGKCPKCGMALTLTPKEQMKVEVVKRYTCPMHPDVALNKDGICPKCGAALVGKKVDNN